MQQSVELVDGFNAIDAQSWDALVGEMPLLKHAFFLALETSGSVGSDTGWQSCPLLLKEGETLIGAMPLYLKHHSYGEYVFDWAWANAYERSGLSYYPKLLSAIPFTPITSERLLSSKPETQLLMVNALAQVMQHQGFSSVHVNFPAENSAQVFKRAGWMQRHGVQFRWENTGFTTFDDFLTILSHDKRKKIRQERKKIVDAQVQCRQIKGAQITEVEWDFFYQCYTNTYFEHRSTPYLTRQFFAEIAQTMPENILLVLAYLDGVPVASALNFYDASSLYGRYWGALQYVPNLHFELCYYQAQEFCIAEKIQFFEGGAQGEHKLARGFKARPTCSFHKIAHPDFEQAIGDFLQRESLGVAAYTNELDERAPFKRRSDDLR